MNNLLERLHASFFFYILTGPDRFLKIGSYLPSAVLISVAMMLEGLKAWINAGWAHELHQTGDSKVGDSAAPSMKWRRKRRPVLKVLSIMISTHLLGAALFSLTQSPWFIENFWVRVQLILCYVPCTEAKWPSYLLSLS